MYKVDILKNILREQIMFQVAILSKTTEGTYHVQNWYREKNTKPRTLDPNPPQKTRREQIM